LFVSAVDNRSILNIGVVTDAYRIDISSYYRLKPDTAVITYDDVSNNIGAKSDKTFLPDLGRIASY